ncbi:hypothetical protein FDP25_09470 [Roseovarius sp. A21]|uniref:Uncharacterized protein n=2 Tax=Roseovarius bejariae TaxID=2576383 RepID=A0A844D342_9RHOB|nr:hypothetical protein [Roseovarius bejariae]
MHGSTLAPMAACSMQAISCVPFRPGTACKPAAMMISLFENRRIDAEAIATRAEQFGKTEYGRYLRTLLYFRNAPDPEALAKRFYASGSN